MPTDACIRIHAFTASTLMTQLRELSTMLPLWSNCTVSSSVNAASLFFSSFITSVISPRNRNAFSDAVISAFPSAYAMRIVSVAASCKVTSMPPSQ